MCCGDLYKIMWQFNSAHTFCKYSLWQILLKIRPNFLKNSVKNDSRFCETLMKNYVTNLYKWKTKKGFDRFCKIWVKNCVTNLVKNSVQDSWDQFCLTSVTNLETKKIWKKPRTFRWKILENDGENYVIHLVKNSETFWVKHEVKISEKILPNFFWKLNRWYTLFQKTSTFTYKPHVVCTKRNIFTNKKIHRVYFLLKFFQCFKFCNWNFVDIPYFMWK